MMKDSSFRLNLRWAVPAAVLLGGLPLSARADVTPPTFMACFDSSTGSRCTVRETGMTGICVARTCTQLDYANWDQATSPTPPTKEVPCRECVSNGQQEQATGQDQSESSSGCNAVSSVGSLGAFVLAGSFSLLFLLRRRRAE